MEPVRDSPHLVKYTKVASRSLSLVVGKLNTLLNSCSKGNRAVDKFKLSMYSRSFFSNMQS